MAHSYLPPFITEYMSSIGENPCWSDWSDVFLSKGGSKEDQKNGCNIDEPYDDSLTRFNTLVTCIDKAQIPVIAPNGEKLLET